MLTERNTLNMTIFTRRRIWRMLVGEELKQSLMTDEVTAVTVVAVTVVVPDAAAVAVAAAVDAAAVDNDDGSVAVAVVAVDDEYDDYYDDSNGVLIVIEELTAQLMESRTKIQNCSHPCLTTRALIRENQQVTMEGQGNPSVLSMIA